MTLASSFDDFNAKMDMTTALGRRSATIKCNSASLASSHSQPKNMTDTSASDTPESVLQGGAVIVLTGLPAVGKTTVARELHRRLNSTDEEPIPAYATRSLLFHHHLVIDYVKALMPMGSASKAHMERRRALLSDAMDLMKANTDLGRIFITTAYATMGVGTDLLRPREMQGYVELARAKCLPFFWIHLTCQPEEHRRRLEDPHRPSTKIKDWDRLMANLAREHDRILLDDKTLDYKGNLHHECFSFDNTTPSAADMAAKILANCSEVASRSRI